MDLDKIRTLMSRRHKFVYISRDANFRKKILTKSLGHCAYCGCALGENFTIDHVVPIWKNGGNEDSNLVAACTPCNASKRDYTLPQWRKRLIRQNNMKYFYFHRLFYFEMLKRQKNNAECGNTRRRLVW
jgi:hypothetical protein